MTMDAELSGLRLPFSLVFVMFAIWLHAFYLNIFLMKTLREIQTLLTIQLCTT